MRKSGRLASIHEDDNPPPSIDDEPAANDVDNGAVDGSAAAKNKKFVPTIPTVRRKKVVEDEVVTETTVNPRQRDNNQQQRRPLGSRYNSQPQPTVVSGPLSMGPAAMARSSSRGSSSGGASSASGIFSARSLSKTSSASNSALNSKPLSDSISVEEEFGLEEARAVGSSGILKPVALSTSSANALEQFLSVESDKLFLFQMPPVLPTLLNHTAAPSASISSDLAEAERWPSTAQGRYGKLRRYKSGRLVLILENGVEFLVSPSSEAGNEAQNTNILAIDPEFGQSFNLGPVQQKFVCVPEFEKFQKLQI